MAQYSMTDKFLYRYTSFQPVACTSNSVSLICWNITLLLDLLMCSYGIVGLRWVKSQDTPRISTQWITNPLVHSASVLQVKILMLAFSRDHPLNIIMLTRLVTLTLIYLFIKFYSILLIWLTFIKILYIKNVHLSHVCMILIFFNLQFLDKLLLFPTQN